MPFGCILVSYLKLTSNFFKAHSKAANTAFPRYRPLLKCFSSAAVILMKRLFLHPARPKGFYKEILMKSKGTLGASCRYLLQGECAEAIRKISK